MADKYAQERRRLRGIADDAARSVDERMSARAALDELPKNSSPNRIRNRCALTGRPRAYIRFFGLSRIAFRDLALKGQLPGVRKGGY